MNTTVIESEPPRQCGYATAEEDCTKPATMRFPFPPAGGFIYFCDFHAAVIFTEAFKDALKHLEDEHR